MGAEFKMNTYIDSKTLENDIPNNFDAVVIAIGIIDNIDIENLTIKNTKSGIVVDAVALTSSKSGFFAGGNAIRNQRMAVRAVGHGKTIAHSVHQYLSGKTPVGIPKKFNSKFSKLFDSELAEYMKEADKDKRVATNDNFRAGFSVEEAILEAKRCMHCDCRKLDNCKLRDYSDEYKASQNTYKQSTRKQLVKYVNHEKIIYEPEKCIKCGICVRITEKHGEKFGLTYIGRGFDIQINAPLSETLNNALDKTAIECAEKCPTGALAIK